MTKLNDILLAKNVTIKDIAEKTNSPYTSIYNASRRDINSWTIFTLNAFAEGLNMNAGELLNLLQESTQPKISFNDEELTLQGYQFSEDEKPLYDYMKKIITQSATQGYIPTSDEIASLLDTLNDKSTPYYQTWRRNWQAKLYNQLKLFESLTKK